MAIVKKTSGQALAEYLLLTALIAVGSFAVVQILGSNIRRKLADVSNAIGGYRTDTHGIKTQEKHYEVQDMGDFTKGLQDNEQK